ncbi:hypothetical protein P692DRAFT_20883522 [Suillus brevipes Sb2]|nr:hypothetical protein P692DRAFT_20883522 [Suillus brevipes Sb2]
MWFLSQLLEASIPFTLAQFPLGFPPPALEDNAFSYEQRSPVADVPSSMNEPSLSTHTTVSRDTPLVFRPPRPAAFNVANSLPPFDHILLSAPDSSSLSASAAHMFSFGHNALYPLPSTGVSDSLPPFEATEEPREVAHRPTLPGVRVQLHPDLQWRESIDHWGECEPNKRATILRLMGKTRWLRILTLTRALLSGSLWVGLYGNPFKITMAEYRRAITCNFLTALRLEGKTYEEISNQPVILMDGQTEVAIGWHMFRSHLLGSMEHTRSELRKVIKGAMTLITGFCDGSTSGLEQEISRYVKLFNSGNCLDVQAAISALTDTQAFAELVWTALMMPIGGLADGKKDGRVGDFFSEDILTEKVKCLAGITFYQTMLLVLKQLLGKERKKELAVYLDHKVMSEVLMGALVPMYEKPLEFPQFTNAVTRLPFIQYENVLHFDPKLKLPRTIGKTKISKTMDDVKPITIVAVESHSKTCFASLRTSNL